MFSGWGGAVSGILICNIKKIDKSSLIMTIFQFIAKKKKCLGKDWVFYFHLFLMAV